ncbi:MAG TPA: POTRA domain-containing protein, partial [Phenylobacterium sp.]|nr:POTRA domain-containing protein [Phenylobacterium sp.]
MHRHRARSAALASGLAGLLASTALATAGGALAQGAPQAVAPVAGPGAPTGALAPPVQTGVVQRIIVKGNERIESSTVISYLPIQAGETVDPAKIDAALKALFRTDLFSDVKIELSAGDLTISIVENPIINRVLFEGNSGLKEDKLRDEVTVRPRGIFTRAKAQQDVGRIVELYRRSGR